MFSLSRGSHPDLVSSTVNPRAFKLLILKTSFACFFCDNRQDKHIVARNICRKVWKLHPPGRFLEMSGLHYVEVDDSRAILRAKQTINNQITAMRTAMASKKQLIPHMDMDACDDGTKDRMWSSTHRTPRTTYVATSVPQKLIGVSSHPSRTCSPQDARTGKGAQRNPGNVMFRDMCSLLRPEFGSSSPYVSLDARVSSLVDCQMSICSGLLSNVRF
jgi:hypothetical protein